MPMRNVERGFRLGGDKDGYSRWCEFVEPEKDPSHMVCQLEEVIDGTRIPRAELDMTVDPQGKYASLRRVGGTAKNMNDLDPYIDETLALVKRFLSQR